VSVVNTLFFVAVGVNLKMFAALLLSGYFAGGGRWRKAVLVAFVLPWFVATVQAYISFHWMLIGDQGLIDRLLAVLFGLEGPMWFGHRWLAVGANTLAYTWQTLPLWTLILLAGRMAIPREIYDAAAIDGAEGLRRFTHVSFPLLARLYLVCTILAAIWAFGDFATSYFVSYGSPTNTSLVLTTLGFRYAFDSARPALAVATAVSALPVLIPAVILLMRRLQTGAVQL
jgi:multiple sugar transport system permease protein